MAVQSGMQLQEEKRVFRSRREFYSDLMKTLKKLSPAEQFFWKLDGAKLHPEAWVNAMQQAKIQRLEQLTGLVRVLISEALGCKKITSEAEQPELVGKIVQHFLAEKAWEPLMKAKKIDKSLAAQFSAAVDSMQKTFSPLLLTILTDIYAAMYPLAHAKETTASKPRGKRPDSA